MADSVLSICNLHCFRYKLNIIICNTNKAVYIFTFFSIDLILKSAYLLWYSLNELKSCLENKNKTQAYYRFTIHV